MKTTIFLSALIIADAINTNLINEYKSFYLSIFTVLFIIDLISWSHRVGNEKK